MNSPAARAWRNIFFLSPSVDSAIASALCSISVVSDCRVFERGAALFRKSKRFRVGGEGGGGQWRFQSGLFEWLSICVSRNVEGGFGRFV